MMFCSCDNEPIVLGPKLDIAYCFGPVSVETTENSAEVDVLKPYITVDGVRLEESTVYVEYWAVGNEAYTTKVYAYKAGSGAHVIFAINDLTPSTLYEATITVDGGEEYGTASKSFAFATTEHVPVCTISCRSEVEAQGLMATLALTDVEYRVDGEPTDIASVKVEYAREAGDEPSWVAIDVDGEKFADGKESVLIPAKGGDYLQENRNYIYRVTITPSDSSFEPLTTETTDFKTDYAEVTAEISTPEVVIEGAMLYVNVESVTVYLDGITVTDYHYLDYYIYMREVGDKEWTELEAELTAEGMKLGIALDVLSEGHSYEFAAAIVAGAAQKVRTSEIATIEIPKEETPVPTPPIGGNSDTTAIAGEWHLTQWRGTTPSFDVYMSITEDGVVSLWQRIESREWQLFYSTVIYEDNTIWGEYTDGIAWGASYYVAIDGDRMTWTDTAYSSDISVYERATLPDDITRLTVHATRSAQDRFL